MSAEELEALGVGLDVVGDGVAGLDVEGVGELVGAAVGLVGVGCVGAAVGLVGSGDVGSALGEGLGEGVGLGAGFTVTVAEAASSSEATPLPGVESTSF